MLGNLEDAIPIDRRRRPRRLIAMAEATDFGATGFGRASNALNSPWFLDDVTKLVGEVGDKLDVVMMPKVEGPLGHSLPRPASRRCSRRGTA